MIFPKYLEKGTMIGVCAPSDGVSDELDRNRFMNAKIKLDEAGYEVKFTRHVFDADAKGRSASGCIRGEEWNELVKDDRVRVIASAKGGNFLNEVLPYVDFEEFRKHPKWFQGYSDNTGLVHAITTKCDVASIYGSNFGEFGMENWHESVQQNLEILTGRRKTVASFAQYQRELTERLTGLEGYEPDTDVQWKCDWYEDKDAPVTFQGRLLGGCLDVLIFLQGTKYDGTLEFIEKYKEDGIVWYLETFDLSAETIMMFLWQLKELGWFRYTKGFLFGRPLFFRDYTNTTYKEAVEYALMELNVPIVFDCDFGHRGPRMSMINGALAAVTYQNGGGKIEYLDTDGTIW